RRDRIVQCGGQGCRRVGHRRRRLEGRADPAVAGAVSAEAWPATAALKDGCLTNAKGRHSTKRFMREITAGWPNQRPGLSSSLMAGRCRTLREPLGSSCKPLRVGIACFALGLVPWAVDYTIS